MDRSLNDAMDISPTIQHLHGRIRSITGTDPAANTEISETVPARRRWKLLAIAFTFVTDENEGNRLPQVVIGDGTTTLFSYLPVYVQTASLTRYWRFANFGSPEVQTGSQIKAPFPTLILAAGYTIQTSTTAFQAADNYGPPHFLVEEWIDP